MRFGQLSVGQIFFDLWTVFSAIYDECGISILFREIDLS